MREHARNRRWALVALFIVCLSLALLGLRAEARSAANAPKGRASIEVDAAQVTGKVSLGIFGQNIEHEHGSISGGEQNMHHEHGLHSGGLWAEMLRDRKFEEGDLDQDGVADGWVPEERITNHFWQLRRGQGLNDRYYIDHHEYYGGGAAQAIELYGADSNHASIYQVDLQFVKGRRYAFYVYLKRRGGGRAWVEFASVGGPVEARTDFPELSENWQKYTAEFTAPVDTHAGWVRIAVEGAGTFWIDSASLMPADNLGGLRRDVVEALKPLKVPLLRYPGGCFADIYHWRDGVGARDRRPERWSSMWNEWEPNDFGTDELMDFARELGFEAHITTNYLSGTPEEAGQWAEYTNGPADSPLGRLRAENGHPEPYGIKNWAVGNESQQLCSGEYFKANDIHDYVRRFQAYKSAIQKADPSVRIMAVGAPPGPLVWNRQLFDMASFELLAASIYTGEGERMDDYDTKITDLTHFYRHVVAEPRDFDHALSEIIGGLRDHLHPGHPSIAVTEFNAWWLTEKVDPDFRLANALYLAGVYHALMRRAQEVAVAELESVVNVQGIVEVNQTAVKLTPEYFVCLLYRNHTGSSVLATQTQSPAVSFDPKLPALDALATLSDDTRTLHLSVINRNESEDVQANVQIRGWAPQASAPAQVYELNGKDRDAANPFGSSENVNIRERSLTVTRTPFSYRFPAHSVTVIELASGR